MLRRFAAKRDNRPIPEFYQLLELHFDASPAEIRRSFLAQVKINHPDVNPEPEAAEKFDR